MAKIQTENGWVRVCPTCKLDETQTQFTAKASYCTSCRSIYDASHKKERAAYHAAYTASHKREKAAYDASHKREKAAYDASRRKETAFLGRRRRIKHPIRELLYGCKARAKKQGLAFDARVEDFVMPERCPVLGIVLTPGTIKNKEASASFDQLIPKCGYITRNMQIISHRANTLKSNGTAAEHRAIADWIDREYATRGIEIVNGEPTFIDLPALAA